jgi:hypothetical protein
MEKEFIPYEQAFALKELGFDEPCLGYYTGDKMHLVIRPLMLRANELESYVATAPLYQQAFRWFRYKYNLLGNVYSNASGWLWEIHDNIGGTHRFGSEYSGDCEESGMFTSFEKAELECLKKLIEIVNG